MKVNNALFIIKITCRYFIPNFEQFINNVVDINTKHGLVQHNKCSCEIIGSSLEYFPHIFNPSIIINNWYTPHVENLYKQRMEIFNDQLIICDEFIIEPTQQGGSERIVTSL